MYFQRAEGRFGLRKIGCPLKINRKSLCTRWASTRSAPGQAEPAPASLSQAGLTSLKSLSPKRAKLRTRVCYAARARRSSPSHVRRLLCVIIMCININPNTKPYQNFFRYMFRKCWPTPSDPAPPSCHVWTLGVNLIFSAKLYGR